MKELKSKVAVITGAGGGIGREIAIALAQEGCHIALCDIFMEGLEETRRLIGPMGCHVSTHHADVADKRRMQHLPEEIFRLHKHIDILVNNAGVASGSLFEDQPLEDFERVIKINLMGLVYGCKFFMPFLKKENEGHIVNLSSIVGLIGSPVLAAYSASKFAVRGFSESLWHEVRDYNIGVTAVFPGVTKTNIFDNAIISEDVKRSNIYNTFKSKITTQATKPTTVAKRVIKGIKHNNFAVISGIDTAIVGLMVKYMPKRAFKFLNYQYQTAKAGTTVMNGWKQKGLIRLSRLRWLGWMDVQ